MKVDNHQGNQETPSEDKKKVVNQLQEVLPPFLGDMNISTLAFDAQPP